MEDDIDLSGLAHERPQILSYRKARIEHHIECSNSSRNMRALSLLSRPVSAASSNRESNCWTSCLPIVPQAPVTSTFLPRKAPSVLGETDSTSGVLMQMKIRFSMTCLNNSITGWRELYTALSPKSAMPRASFAKMSSDQSQPELYGYPTYPFDLQKRGQMVPIAAGFTMRSRQKLVTLSFEPVISDGFRRVEGIPRCQSVRSTAMVRGRYSMPMNMQRFRRLTARDQLRPFAMSLLVHSQRRVAQRFISR